MKSTRKGTDMSISIEAEAEVALMPEPILMATSTAFTLAHLRMYKEEGGIGYRYAGMFDGSCPWLLGYRLPPFQRPLVWTQEQKIRFVESAWLGFSLGTWCANKMETRHPTKAHPFDRWLIDGQQRLSALDEYWDDGFPVFGHVWSGLTRLDRRRFESRTFPVLQTHLNDENALRELYDRMNFGGTAFTGWAEECNSCRNKPDWAVRASSHK